MGKSTSVESGEVNLATGDVIGVDLEWAKDHNGSKADIRFKPDSQI